MVTLGACACSKSCHLTALATDSISSVMNTAAAGTKGWAVEANGNVSIPMTKAQAERVAKRLRSGAFWGKVDAKVVAV